jgi:hypothetical protein
MKLANIPTLTWLSPLISPWVSLPGITGPLNGIGGLQDVSTNTISGRSSNLVNGNNVNGMEGMSKLSNKGHDRFPMLCNDFKNTVSFDHNVTIVSSEFVKGDARLRFPGVSSSCLRTVTIGAFTSVDICRVIVRFTTSDTSQTEMEAWMPRNWTGRVASTGNGGVNGCK